MLLAARDNALAGLWFTDQQHLPEMSGWTPGECAVLRQAQSQLDEYFAGQLRQFDLALAAGAGTPFQQAVWAALRDIDYGQRCTYAAVAERIGRPRAVRAVGAAVGRNPWGIVVPCHRVLGSNGTLTGYAGGLERKRALLLLETPE